MTSDFDKQQWQTEQAARDAGLEKQREKERKARKRSARNAKRKLERLQRTLSETGEITDFESEFSDSVSERLDQFGSAFHDCEKGRPGDALSFAQKRVVASMNRKVKDLRARRDADGDDVDGNDADRLERPSRTSFKPRSSFKTKGRTFKPRVRQLDETFETSEMQPDATRPEPFIPERDEHSVRPPVGRPFLRVVRNGD
ncbi:hypothetical protein ACFFUB_08405 [Algimonas porphyrae]|uniref:Uncharacterized protein n=1 Tax=Algimonas porphyrae TaxID=1128113 RepID=A0ABQ5V520_9PROT|nr:hypothetical protein [Algimonas porphyrae]GLQ22067.1 hypothetical protein GCM10007854_30220 [Algimonas porphyrae]